LDRPQLFRNRSPIGEMHLRSPIPSLNSTSSGSFIGIVLGFIAMRLAFTFPTLASFQEDPELIVERRDTPLKTHQETPESHRNQMSGIVLAKFPDLETKILILACIYENQ
jgi:hypothetical protein